jgi:hypothetical protein
VEEYEQQEELHLLGWDGEVAWASTGRLVS